MSGLKLNPKDFKSVKSDGKSTTLEHKNGHTITIQHNVLAPKDRSMLQALSKIGMEHMTSDQSQEKQDQSQYGKVIMKSDGGKVSGGTGSDGKTKDSSVKMAEGGDLEPKKVFGMEVYGTGRSKSAPQQESSAPDSDEPWPSPSETSVGKALAAKQQPQAEATGGEIHNKTCMSCGGPARQMYAEGDEVTPNIDPSLLTPQQAPQGMQDFQPPDPEKSVLSGVADSVKEWAMTPVNPNAAQQSGITPADVAATKANANVDSLKGQEQQAQTVAAAADQNAAQSSSSGMPDYGSLLGKGYGQEEQGTKELGAAEGAKGAAQAQVLEQGAAQQQDIMNHYQGSLDTINNERQGFIKDIQNGLVDPEKYWKGDAQGNGSHSKIAAGIGMILGGFNPTSNPNAAIDFLNHQMDRNIDAQKQNLGAKQNLLSANIAQFKNINEATAMTKLMQADMIQTQLAKAAATAATPIAAAQAKAAQGAIAAKYAPLAMNLQIMKMMNGLGSGGTNVAGSTGAALSALDRMAPDQARNYRERYYQPFDLPGGKSIADRPIPQDVRQTLNAQDILDAKGKDILGFIKQNSGTWSIPKRAIAQQKVEEMKNFYNDSIHGGALTEGRLGWYDEQFKKHPTDIVAQMLGNTAKLQEMVNSNEARKNTTLNSYGLKPPQSRQQSQHPMEGKTASDGRGNKIQMINGKWTPVGR